MALTRRKALLWNEAWGYCQVESSHRIGSFYKWGYPNLDGWCRWCLPILLEWMTNRSTPAETTKYSKLTAWLAWLLSTVCTPKIDGFPSPCSDYYQAVKAEATAYPPWSHRGSTSQNWGGRPDSTYTVGVWGGLLLPGHALRDHKDSRTIWSSYVLLRHCAMVRCTFLAMNIRNRY